MLARGNADAGNGTRWRLTGITVAAIAVALTTLILYPLREVAPPVSLGVVYLLGVLLVASIWGLWLGVLAAIASAAAFNFFHIPPTGRFTIAEGEHWVALVVFFAAAVVAAESLRRLAAVLGAHLLVEEGRDVAAVGARVARERGTTYILIGVPRQRRGLARLAEPLAIRLVRALPDVDVRIVTDRPAERQVPDAPG